MMPWGHGHWTGGDWLAMTLMMLAFWGLLVALMVTLVRRPKAQAKTPSHAHLATVRADDVLAERFARGEIDEDEFTRRRALLHASIAERTQSRNIA
jgi:putative membrane protein